MKEELLQIPVTFQDFKSMKNRSLRMWYDSQENLSDEQVAKITRNHNKFGWLSFLVAERQLTPDDMLDLPEIVDDTKYKTPSQRLRGILYRVWEKQGKKGNFEEFYIIKMDMLASWLKDKYLT